MSDTGLQHYLIAGVIVDDDDSTITDCVALVPKTRTEFWTNKIKGNRTRDARNYSTLRDAGWKPVVIWECAVSKKLCLSKAQFEEVVSAALVSTETLIDIRGYSGLHKLGCNL